jgi:hypothetical protein
MDSNKAELHLLRLIKRSPKKDGWASVSKFVWPLLETVAEDLIEKKQIEDNFLYV